MYKTPNKNMSVCLSKGGRGDGGLKKYFFRPFGPQFGLTIRGGAGLQAPPGSATEQGCALVEPADL